jgi:hypothetical protein
MKTKTALTVAALLLAFGFAESTRAHASTVQTNQEAAASAHEALISDGVMVRRMVSERDSRPMGGDPCLGSRDLDLCRAWESFFDEMGHLDSLIGSPPPVEGHYGVCVSCAAERRRVLIARMEREHLSGLSVPWRAVVAEGLKEMRGGR